MESDEELRLAVRQEPDSVRRPNLLEQGLGHEPMVLRPSAAVRTPPTPARDLPQQGRALLFQWVAARVRGTCALKPTATMQEQRARSVSPCRRTPSPRSARPVPFVGSAILRAACSGLSLGGRSLQPSLGDRVGALTAGNFVLTRVYVVVFAHAPFHQQDSCHLRIRRRSAWPCSARGDRREAEGRGRQRL